MTSPREMPPSAEPDLQRLQAQLDESALVFHTGVVEQMLRRDPDNIDLLTALAQSYAQLARHEQGLVIDRQLVAAQPENATFHYNLACSLTLTGDLEGAAGALMAAIDRGYRDFEHLLRDVDLSALREDVRFARVADRMARLAPDQSAAER